MQHNEPHDPSSASITHKNHTPQPKVEIIFLSAARVINSQLKHDISMLVLHCWYIMCCNTLNDNIILYQVQYNDESIPFKSILNLPNF